MKLGKNVLYDLKCMILPKSRTLCKHHKNTLMAHIL